MLDIVHNFTIKGKLSNVQKQIVIFHLCTITEIIKVQEQLSNDGKFIKLDNI